MLYLTKEHLGQLLADCQSEFPNEACAILAGKDGKVEKIYPMSNTDKSAKSFLMDPAEQIKVMKEIRNLGLAMVGICHSHPETAAYPSKNDVELAYYPEASYVIVSLKDKVNPRIRSFRIIDAKIEEEVISYNPKPGAKTKQL